MVVDEKGKAVEGALVVSEEHPFILQSKKLGVYLTNKKGEARIVGPNGHIFKPGYYPIVNGSELAHGLLWKTHPRHSKEIPIYPIVSDQKTPVSISSYFTRKADIEGVYHIPIDVCRTTRVTYSIANSILKAESDNLELLPSNRFFFLPPDSYKKVLKIEKENNLAFYCEDKSGLYKLGVSVSEKIWNQGNPAHKLTIFLARISSLKEYIQPNIKCASREYTKMLESDTKPNLYISHNFSNLFDARDYLSHCSEEYIDSLIEYVEELLIDG